MMPVKFSSTGVRNNATAKEYKSFWPAANIFNSRLVFDNKPETLKDMNVKWA